MPTGKGFLMRDFISKPNAELLKNISRLDWIALAKFYGVEIVSTWKKQEILNAVCDFFMTNNILTDKDCLMLMQFEETEEVSEGSNSETSENNSSSDEEKGAKSVKPKKSDRRKKKFPQITELTEAQMEFQIKIKQMELEARRVEKQLEVEAELKVLEARKVEKPLEAEARRVEAEARNVEKQLEVEAEQKRFEAEQKKLELELEMRKLEGPKDEQSRFKVDHAVKSVPFFLESEVDSFFLQFEKIAVQRKWPRDQWSTLVQTSFIGKAREVYAAMSLDDSKEYEIVKREVLKAYEWVSERYREKFRGWQKRDQVNHMEFAREQKLWFDRWVSSKNIDKDYSKLEELILLE